MTLACSHLLHHIYREQEHVYLCDLAHTALGSARATFVFEHNPRTRDYTHVGAAEMLAGLSQAAYGMAARYSPDLLVDEFIERCYFRAVKVTFAKMLAPKTEATLSLQMTLQPDGLPRFDFDGFIEGSVECGLAENSDKTAHASRCEVGLPPRVDNTLRTFYNNGSALTLKSLTTKAAGQWRSHSEFEADSRLRLCRYTTTTQVIIGLSQVAFAVVGEANAGEGSALGWENEDFLNSMGDQALVKLSYARRRSAGADLTLDSTISRSKTLRGCKFIRLALDGDLQGTMDSMLSPRVPVRTVRSSSVRG